MRILGLRRCNTCKPRDILIALYILLVLILLSSKTRNIRWIRTLFTITPSNKKNLQSTCQPLKVREIASRYSLIKEDKLDTITFKDGVILNTFPSSFTINNENRCHFTQTATSFNQRQNTTTSFNQRQNTTTSFNQRQNTTSSNQRQNTTSATIMIVMSDASAFNKRSGTRRFYYKYLATDKNKALKLVFFVGRFVEQESNRHYTSLQMENNLRKESDRYRDIIQLDIPDTSYNKVDKFTAVLQWIDTFCTNAIFAMILEDTVLVDAYFAVRQLYKTFINHKHFLLGRVLTKMTPNRTETSPWFVAKREFPNATYPPFLRPEVVAIPTHTAGLLLQQAQRTPKLRFHHIFITGVCANTLGIPLLGHPVFTFDRKGFVGNTGFYYSSTLHK